MEKPNYVLRTDEAVLVPKYNSVPVRFLKTGLLAVILVLVVGSLVFRDNLFAELSWSTKVMLVFVAMVVFGFLCKQENVPSPIELQFYGDCLVLYRPSRYYSNRVTRMEINRMPYTGITRCVLESRSQRVHIYGDVDATWYDYGKNGKLPGKPAYQRMVKDTMIYFSTRCAQDVVFKQVIEAHSPVRVIIEDL